MITPEMSQKMDEILHRMSHTQDHSQQFFIHFRKELKGTFFKEELVELYKRAMSLPYNPQVPAIMHGIAVTYNQGVPLDQKEDLFKKVEELIKTNKEMDMPKNSQAQYAALTVFLTGEPHIVVLQEQGYLVPHGIRYENLFPFAFASFLQSAAMINTLACRPNQLQ